MQTHVLQARGTSPIRTEAEGRENRCWPWPSPNHSAPATATTAATKGGSKGRASSIIIHISDVGSGGTTAVNTTNEHGHEHGDLV